MGHQQIPRLVEIHAIGAQALLVRHLGPQALVRYDGGATISYAHKPLVMVSATMSVWSSAVTAMPLQN